jgi:hypothetical protein
MQIHIISWSLTGVERLAEEPKGFAPALLPLPLAPVSPLVALLLLLLLLLVLMMLFVEPPQQSIAQVWPLYCKQVDLILVPKGSH